LKIGRNYPCPCGSGKKYKYCCLNSKATKYKPILLLFGAGASLGSGGMTFLPPSGTELLGILRKTYPETWGKISGTFADNFKTLTFEGGMLALYESPRLYNVNDLLSDMGLYFSKFTINIINENLYFRLFNRYRQDIVNGKIILSTLNYECLIEYALIGLNIPFDFIDYFNKDTGVKLLKLHGSCNFIPQGLFVAKAKNALVCPSINTPVKAVQPEKAIEELSNNGIMPAMSLYAKGKNNIVCEQQILAIQKKFQEISQVAKTIISIGVRPNADDHHIWDYIVKSGAEIIIIAGKEHCQEWISEYPNWKFIGDKFDSAYAELCKNIDNRLQ
jgi:hypothetical protein